MGKDIAPYLGSLIAVAFLLWRNSRAQGTRLRLRAMWLGPAIISLFLILLLVEAPPPLGLTTMLGFPAALALGGALGWLRARHMALTIDAKTGAIASKATPIGMILILALFAARFALKLYFPQMNSPQGAHLAGQALVWTDLGLLFSAGLVWGRAVTLMLRVRPLLEAHKARQAVAPVTPPA